MQNVDPTDLKLIYCLGHVGGNLFSFFFVAVFEIQYPHFRQAGVSLEKPRWPQIWNSTAYGTSVLRLQACVTNLSHSSYLVCSNNEALTKYSTLFDLSLRQNLLQLRLALTLL